MPGVDQHAFDIEEIQGSFNEGRISVKRFWVKGSVCKNDVGDFIKAGNKKSSQEWEIPNAL